MDRKYIKVIDLSVALKALNNGILKLLGSRVTTEISGYKDILAHDGCAHDERQSTTKIRNISNYISFSLQMSRRVSPGNQN